MTFLHAIQWPSASIMAWMMVAMVFLLSLGSTPAWAQDQSSEGAPEKIRANPFGTGAGGQILLTNNGFGLGGYYRREVNATTSFLVEASLGPGKDDRELKFSQYGRNFIPNKRNYFLMSPVHIGIQHRLFSEHIEENFRPYLHVTGGPTLGWEYPYFGDENGNNLYDEDIDQPYDIFSAFPRGRMRFGLGGMLALGANFGSSRRVTQGIRFGYALNYFLEGIQLLEPEVKGAQKLFHSPVISITFGKLF